MARPPLAFHEQTDVHTRKLIADALFWPGAAKAHSGLKQYFEYYDSQIRQIRTYEVLGSADKAGAIRTHIDMLGVLEVLRQHRGAGRADMRDHLRWSRRGISQEGLVLDWAIAVTLRLCLMLDIFDHSSQRVHEHSIPQEWRDGSLENWLGSLVPKSKMTPSHVESRQDPSFTAAFMVDVCGLTIRWTKSLPEHLLFDPKRRELAIFPHKEYIRALTERKKTAPNSLPNLWPNEVLEEVMGTLFLLFPAHNEHTQKILSLTRPGIVDWGLNPVGSLRKFFKWIFAGSDARARDIFQFANQNITNVLPKNATKFQRLDEFQYFRDRLLIVHREVYKCQPTTWHQLFRDNRNPQQYWTFWLAIWILLLTVISTISGVVSMVTGIVSMQLAQDQARAPQQTVFCVFNTSSSRL